MKKYIFAMLLVSIIFFMGCQTSGVFVGHSSDTSGIETYNLAKKYYNRGNFEKAILHYKKFLSEGPQDAMYEIALYYLANSYEMVNDNNNALLNYQKLIGINGDEFWVDLAKERIEEIRSNR